MLGLFSKSIYPSRRLAGLLLEPLSSVESESSHSSLPLSFSRCSPSRLARSLSVGFRRACSRRSSRGRTLRARATGREQSRECGRSRLCRMSRQPRPNICPAKRDTSPGQKSAALPSYSHHRFRSLSRADQRTVLPTSSAGVGTYGGLQMRTSSVSASRCRNGRIRSHTTCGLFEHRKEGNYNSTHLSTHPSTTKKKNKAYVLRCPPERHARPASPGSSQLRPERYQSR